MALTIYKGETDDIDCMQGVRNRDKHEGFSLSEVRGKGSEDKVVVVGSTGSWRRISDVWRRCWQLA